MNFDFSDDQKVLRDQARKFLSEYAAPARVRRILESDEPYDRELWRGMVELAWPGTAIPESYGGAGFGHLELCVIAEELGRSLAPTPFSSSVYLATEALLLAGTEAQKRRWLPKLAMGEAIGAFALAEGPAAPDGRALATRVVGGRMTGTKVPVADGDVADFAVVAAATTAESTAGTVGGMATAREEARGAASVGDRATAVGLFVVDLHGPGVTRAPERRKHKEGRETDNNHYRYSRPAGLT
jgi:acyl-CoA dehydrogenase